MVRRQKVVFGSVYQEPLTLAVCGTGANHTVVMAGQTPGSRSRHGGLATTPTPSYVPFWASVPPSVLFFLAPVRRALPPGFPSFYPG